MDVVVVAVAVVLTGLLGWFFFGPRSSHRATLDQGVQTLTVSVKGGYSPDVIEVVQGVPVRLWFDRQESGDCSSRVVFPDFKVNQTLPAYATTAVEFTPRQDGEYAFACGMIPTGCKGFRLGWEDTEALGLFIPPFFLGCVLMITGVVLHVSKGGRDAG